MNPCGIIATYISRQDFIGKTFWVKLRTAFFNCKIFIGQLAFMIVGTAIGKIKWPETLDSRQHRSFLIMVSGLFLLIEFNISMYRLPYHWWSLAAAVFVGIVGLLEYRCIRWRKVWRAAQCSHVRLCLKKITLLGVYEQWLFINFGYPKAEIQPWRIDQCKGQFEYRDPTFDPSPRFIEAMIEYAEEQVGKRYDEVQLLSPAVNFPLWIFYWPWWGQEKIKAFNRPGALEYCSSGFTADLRWAEGRVDERGIRQSIRSLHDTAYSLVGRESEEMTDEYIEIMKRTFTKFFEGYDTAMVSPCLIAIDRNWEVT